MVTVSTEGAEKLSALREQAEALPLRIQVKHDPAKRTFDIFFSALFLILLSPLFIILSLLIFFTSPGPIFYKSRRLGRGGKIIHCWKFRTMYKDADARLHQLLKNDSAFHKEWTVFQKVRLDPRITPVGQFLRKTSLDELPQFWNVLKGDLSVVGPRPPTLIGPAKELFREIRKLYAESTDKILSVRPGITGLWQISGRSQITFEERRKIEEQYVDTRSFWKDLVVVLKTIPAVLFSRGAC